MEERKKYEPLVEKILEQLEGGRDDSHPGELCAKYNLEVPRIKPVDDNDLSPAVAPPDEPARTSQSTPFYPNLADLADLARAPEDTPENSALDAPLATPVQAAEKALPAPKTQTGPDDMTALEMAALTTPQTNPQTAPLTAPLTVPLASPLAIPVTRPAPPPEAPAATRLYDDTALQEPAVLPAAPIEHEERTDADDELPALFHRYEHPTEQLPPRKPVKSIIAGVSGTAILGAIGLFLIPQEPPSLNMNTSGTLSSSTFPTPPVEKLSLFSEDSDVSAAKAARRKADNENELDAIRPLSPDRTQARERDAAPARPRKKPPVFASINGPVEKLLDNVVEELTDRPRRLLNKKPGKKTLPVPIPGAETTLNQLERSLENIGSLSSPVTKNEPTQGSGGHTVIVQNNAVAANAQTPGASVKSPPDKMQLLTDKVVDALSDLNGSSDEGAVPLDKSVDRLRESLSDLVLEAEQRGKSAGSVELLLKEALGNNQKNLPAALKNAEGQLDISSLIASVVKKAEGTGQGAGADADYLALIESEGQKTALTSRLVRNKAGKRYLMVKKGDTLSSIAYATYGDSFQYPRIFKANKATISNPNALKVGMRLLIP